MPLIRMLSTFSLSPPLLLPAHHPLIPIIILHLSSYHMLLSYPLTSYSAIARRSFGPSYPKLKEAVLHAFPLLIITARGQSPFAVQTGLHRLIEATFTEEEMKQTLESITGNYFLSRTFFLSDVHFIVMV